MGVDLHIHSQASDGTLTVAQIVEKADRQGLSAISITDHDTVAGIDMAINESADLSLRIIPGIELSCVQDKKDVHILGYFIDYNGKELLDNLIHLRSSRASRAEDMVNKLRDTGLDISYEEVKKCAHGGAIGRPHIAQILVKNGLVDSISEAFNKHIGPGGPSYMPKYVLEVTKVISLIHDVGGVASVAHPGVSGVNEDFLLWLKEVGLDAVEVWHTEHTETQTHQYKELTKKHNLLRTGGSDCHGLGKSRGYVLGSVDIPDKIIEPLETRSSQIRTLKNIS